MPTQVQINAASQFDQFVRFAEHAMGHGNTKAIARVDSAKVESVPAGGMSVRTITAATDDKVYAIRRSSFDKIANDVTRDRFMLAVSNMFGGEDHIPASVLKAMNMKDYGHGKPLTARRIMAVNTAIIAARNKALITDAVSFVGQLDGDPEFRLTSGQQKKAIGLLLKHGQALTGKNASILANNIVRIVTDPALARRADAYVAEVVKRISRFDDFVPGDPRTKDLDEAFLKYNQGTIKEICQSSSAEIGTDGISNAFMKDATRSDYTIAGRTFTHATVPAADIAAALKSVVTNPLHRKVLSTILTQNAGNSLLYVMMGATLPPTVGHPDGGAMHAAKGGEMLVGAPMTDRLYGLPPCHGGLMRFQLDILPDGKTAKFTHTLHGGLRFGIADTDLTIADRGVAKFTMTQELTFDLSEDEPKLLDYHLGQSIDATATVAD
jgi:hypothetical protein